MRIVAGQYGGRVLQTPKNNAIRPTSDKIRGAMFNALQSRGAVEDAIVLDCFCGTGALGIEALSQGAEHCTFIDKARTSLDLAKNNAQVLEIKDEATFMLKDAGKLPVRSEDVQPATLIFLDPPYEKNLISTTLETLSAGDWIAPNAIIVAESEKPLTLNLPDTYETLSEKVYGDTKVVILRYSV